MNQDIFTEPLLYQSDRYKKTFAEPEAEADRRLERFTAKALEELGNAIGTRALILTIRDLQRDRQIIRSKLTREYNGWELEVDRDETSVNPSPFSRRSIPKFVLKSHFHYLLDLPHRWSGMLNIEFPGIIFLSPEHHQNIRRSIAEFSTRITIMLLERQLAQVEAGLNEEKEVSAGLNAFVTTLSKELYCLSAISNALGQSHNVEIVLTKVLETTLPILGARLGVIFFPATGQCVTLHSPRTRPRDNEHPWFRLYFESEMQSLDFANWSTLSLQSVADHPRFSSSLKEHLASQQIESVLEFSLLFQNEVVGLGSLGFKKNHDQPGGTRLLMIALNMIGLFLQQISFMGDLERQVKLISQEKIEMEKKHRFLMDHMGQPFVMSRSKRPLSSNMLFEEIERARNMALLAELASGVAHQIRNPLSNLLYALHLVQQGGLPSEEKEELFQSIIERVETMNRMINEFVQYTRIPDLKLSVESINQVLADTLRTFRAWAEISDVTIIEQFDPELPMTRLDIFLINQAFHNVIKNALEAIRNKGRLRVFTRKLNIRHGPKPHLEFAEIVFEDDGPGIASGYLQEVIKPFFSKKKDGMGLGLALVDHIVRAHGGAMNLENRSEGGTRVRMYLPIR